jgi:hypothetical protein
MVKNFWPMPVADGFGIGKSLNSLPEKGQIVQRVKEVLMVSIALVMCRHYLFPGSVDKSLQC